MIGNKKILCVITARAGSRGIPGKNYKKLLGFPLFWWSVEAGLKSGYVDVVAISSNCKECKKIYDMMLRDSKYSDVIWIERPYKYATPFSKNEEAMLHAAQKIIDDSGFYPDVLINLQPTSPCRVNNLLDQCIEAYYEGDHDSLLTGYKETPFIWQKIDGRWEYTVDENCCKRKMRQEFDESEFIYHDNGSVYITDYKVMFDTGCRIGYNPIVFETTGMCSIQVDTENDFQLIKKFVEIEDLESLI